MVEHLLVCARAGDQPGCRPGHLLASRVVDARIARPGRHLRRARGVLGGCVARRTVAVSAVSWARFARIRASVDDVRGADRGSYRRLAARGVLLRGSAPLSPRPARDDFLDAESVRARLHHRRARLLAPRSPLAMPCACRAGAQTPLPRASISGPFVSFSCCSARSISSRATRSSRSPAGLGGRRKHRTLDARLQPADQVLVSTRIGVWLADRPLSAG